MSSPAFSSIAVTPSDSTILPETRALYIGNGGNVAVTTRAGDSTFVNVVGGTILPVACTKVLSTGTTATSILALR